MSWSSLSNCKTRSFVDVLGYTWCYVPSSDVARSHCVLDVNDGTPSTHYLAFELDKTNLFVGLASALYPCSRTPPHQPCVGQYHTAVSVHVVRGSLCILVSSLLCLCRPVPELSTHCTAGHADHMASVIGLTSHGSQPSSKQYM